MAVIQRRRLGDLLIECGLISQDELAEALVKQKQTGERLGEFLIRTGLVTQDDIIWALGDQLNISYVHLSEDLVDPAVVRSFPLGQMSEHSFIPVFRISNEITVIMADPLDIDALNALESLTSEEINISIGSEREIHEYLSRIFDTVAPAVTKPTETYASEDGEKPIRAHEILENQLSSLGPERALQHLLVENLSSLGDALAIRYEAGQTIVYQFSHAGTPQQIAVLSGQVGEPLLAAACRLNGNTSEDPYFFSEGLIQLIDRTPSPDVHLVTAQSRSGGWEIYAERLSPVSQNPFLTLEDDESLAEKLELSWRMPGGLVLATGYDGTGLFELLRIFTALTPPPGKNRAIILGERFWNIPGGWTSFHLPYDRLERLETLRQALRLKPDVLLIDSIREKEEDRDLIAMACRAACSGVRVVAAVESHSFSKIRSLIGDTFFSRCTRIVAVRYLADTNCPGCLVETEQAALPSNMVTLPGNTVPEMYHGEGCDRCQETGITGTVPVVFAAPHSEEGLQKGLVDAERRALGRLVSSRLVSPSIVRNTLRFVT